MRALGIYCAPSEERAERTQHGEDHGQGRKYGAASEGGTASATLTCELLPEQCHPAALSRIVNGHGLFRQEVAVASGVGALLEDDCVEGGNSVIGVVKGASDGAARAVDEKREGGIVVRYFGDE